MSPIDEQKQALEEKSANTGVPQGVIISALLWQELQKAKPNA
jgi:hypothetical protein